MDVGIGVNPILKRPVELSETCRLVPGYFPQDFVGFGDPFDVITLLAVVEHVSRGKRIAVANAYWNVLTPEGQMVITGPHPSVNRIVEMLKSLWIIMGLSLEEHHGFHPG